MDYTASISTTVSPERASQAVTDDLEHWWSTRIERRTDGFTTRFNNSHATFHFEPGPDPLSFTWTCTDAHMIIEDVEDSAEWVGTQLMWQITATETGCEIHLTHKRLGPTLPCFDVCQRGWQHFFETSLRDHLNSNDGAPNTT
ncbi:MAG: hypothetical protein AAFO97_16685 [Pseudomonadota bacterium]